MSNQEGLTQNFDLVKMPKSSLLAPGLNRAKAIDIKGNATEIS